MIPEFTADVGTKKGEKIDYAIVHDGQIQVLVEVKKINDPLRIEHASQLFRYFAVTNARIAILTNGETYQFYTDLDAPNRMDAKPFGGLCLALLERLPYDGDGCLIAKIDTSACGFGLEVHAEVSISAIL